MVFVQSNTIKEFDGSSVSVSLVVSDTYSGLFASEKIPTRGLKIKRVSRSLSNDGVKTNTIVELEYHETQKYENNNWVPIYSSEEFNTLNILKNEGFLGVFIDNEPMYIGKIKSGWEFEYFSLKNGIRLGRYKFTTEPKTRGLFSEVTLGEVILNINGQIDGFSAYGIGVWSESEYNEYEKWYSYKDFFGHWQMEKAWYRGFAPNLISLNSFLNKFCEAVETTISQKFGTNISLTIETKELPGWFIPRHDTVNWQNFSVTRKTKIFQRRIMQISSTDTDREKSFFIDAGMFFEPTIYDKIWSADSNARLNEHLKWQREKILSLTVEQFLNRLGANFGLLTNITTVDEVNYIVKYIEPTTNSMPIQILTPTKATRTREEQEHPNVNYEVHFSIFETEDWNEFCLREIEINDTEIIPKSEKPFTSETNGEKVELFWGFFPMVYIRQSVNGRSMLFTPNTYLRVRTESKNPWTERSTILFNRMLWMLKTQTDEDEEWTPNLQVVPVLVWQIDVPQNSSIWELFRCFRWFLTQRVMEQVSFPSTERLSLELPKFNSGYTTNWSWKNLVIGNYMNFDNEQWRIVGTEFDFDNWRVKIEAIK